MYAFRVDMQLEEDAGKFDYFFFWDNWYFTKLLAIQKKTKALVAAEGDDDDDYSDNEKDDNPLPPNKCACTGTHSSNRLSMGEAELAFAKQFQHSSTFTDSGHNSGDEQGSGVKDVEEDQQDKEDKLMPMDQNNDVEETFGGEESNGVCYSSYCFILLRE